MGGRGGRRMLRKKTKCELVKCHVVKRRGRASIEFYDDDGDPQYYCEGYNDDDYPSMICRNCPDFVDRANEDIEEMNARNE